MSFDFNSALKVCRNTFGIPADYYQNDVFVKKITLILESDVLIEGEHGSYTGLTVEIMETDIPDPNIHSTTLKFNNKTYRTVNRVYGDGHTNILEIREV